MAFELGKIFFDRIIEIDLALIDKHHERGCSEGLGDRSDPEEGIGGHGGPGCEVAKTDGLEVDGVVLVGDKRDGAGNGVVVDEGL